MKIAILGFGVEGRSAFDYWHSATNELTICDQSESIEAPSGAGTKLGPDYLSRLDEFDLIVRSPGIHPSDIVNANDPSILDKVTTSTNEFFKVSPSKNIIGVTGTKGKGTTSTLITKLLEASGHRVHLGGNIGKSAIDLLADNIQPEDWVVLEMSNFQLIDLKYSPKIGVCLMIVPEHLDWHSDVDEYVGAKRNMFIHQSSSDIAIYYVNNQHSRGLADQSPGRKIPYFAEPGAYVENDQFVIGGQVVCRTNEIKLLGKHNWQNVCAGITAYWQVDQDLSAVRSVITSFEGLPHRLELVREVDGVKYYNDSFASGPDAAVAAIKAIPGHKVVIIGGFDRGLELSHLADSINEYQNELRKVILIGASAKRTVEALTKTGFTNFEVSEAKSMPEIVKLAGSVAEPNDSVVLSPGFASFDLFKNFEDRGQKFKAAVNEL